VSTSRVSQTIAKLERRVGAPLFNRTSRRVELTAVGRRLQEDLRPAWAQIAAAIERAIDTGRGLTGTLRVAFVGAAGGQLLTGAVELFRVSAPGCEVRLREAQMVDVFPWLRNGDVDLALATLPVDEPDITCGPVLVSEARMLAVASNHPLARRESVSLEDLAQVKVMRMPASLPASLHQERTPRATPTGRPVRNGPAAETFNEMLTLIGAGHGAFPVGAQTRRYYARPDVTYVPFNDAPPLQWALMWRADGATARVRAFNDAAVQLVGH
jgi:DNA-binding transcriptional LysR family regulator